MSQTVLLEIGLEEMPAKYVRSSSIQLKEKMAAFLEANRIGFDAIEMYATPRRLAVIASGVSDKQADLAEVIKGPAKKIALQADGTWSKAALGFVRGQGLTPEDIFFDELNSVEYVFVKKETNGKASSEVLKELNTVVESLTFPVSMHWGNHHFKYIRPIHWIVALADAEIIPFQVLDVVSGRTTRGHRFLGEDVTLAHAGEYVEKLAEQHVIADQDKRKNMIRAQFQQIEAENGWIIPNDESLLEEVTSLVEYPTAFFGEYDSKYLTLPADVLITSMKDHQRYFEVKDKSGKLLPYFISVRNGNGIFIDNVKKGNEKVLTARLEDGLFFFNEDQRITIAQSVEKLKKVTFHSKIGSIHDKMDNTAKIAAHLADLLDLEEDDKTQLLRAASIYKFDLVTNMVSEFTELQGIMGEVYALQQGETAAVATAIREHYLPVSSEGELPETQIGAVLAMADKLDSIISFFLQGMVPTGSNDPYALRRQMIGVIQIIEKYQWSFSLEDLLSALLTEVFAIEDAESFDKTMNELAVFANGRIQQKLQTYGIRYDIVEAVLQSGEKDVNTLFANAKVLQAHSEEESFKTIMEALARVVNISGNPDESIPVQKDLLETASEKNLYVQINHLDLALSHGDPEADYTALAAIAPYIEAYFDENMVMVEDVAIRSNRLNTLGNLTLSIMQFADVRKLILK
ncbi:glycine--tRNA ligase subunit beta [Trichococcus shcherbakoviae]|uniref:Glycine--tRNA ligase beta subunit n=1 Tax=Trichococcus shcherbakoviae subsp. psychrophilus TaxID=2585775 RepID=A0A5C5E8V3_9LACT|nr:glycine--tRNA ligase subunit beta [Trichococcus shcherbakoviae]TNV68966.1 glycine--tRNA ligase subunit beta [Trichococcus shcherbakoviae subsp. psychrophilus]